MSKSFRTSVPVSRKISREKISRDLSIFTGKYRDISIFTGTSGRYISRDPGKYRESFFCTHTLDAHVFEVCFDAVIIAMRQEGPIKCNSLSQTNCFSHPLCSFKVYIMWYYRECHFYALALRLVHFISDVVFKICGARLKILTLCHFFAKNGSKRSYGNFFG